MKRDDITLDADGATDDGYAQTVLSTRKPATLGTGAHAGRVLSERYHLLRPLGSGGMGEVYEAEHLALGTPLAVKVMHEHIALHPNAVRRFSREAHAASLLNHENVVRVLDCGDDKGTFYIAMELLAGKSLSEWIAQMAEPPPIEDVADIVRQTLDALERAHSFGVIHRDLKPENIFLTEALGKRVVKVLDFGLAHVEDPRDEGTPLTNTDTVGGTPAYMSPEQCRTLSVEPSADLYSLGCVLTMLLQRSPPFQGPSVVDVISAHMFLPPPPLDRAAGLPPVPPLLERLRLDLLAKTPEKRPRDAAEARARLLEAMSPEATAARLPARKGDEPLGSRMDRIPDWSGASAGKPGRADGVSAPLEARVGFLRGSGAEGGVSASCVTGLAAQGIFLVEAASIEEVVGSAWPVVLLDAGADIEKACAWLRRLAEASPGRRAVVCAQKPGIERMNALIAAGAADVITYPVSPDALGKKLARLLRRAR